MFNTFYYAFAGTDIYLIGPNIEIYINSTLCDEYIDFKMIICLFLCKR